jgi:lipopolysaccharide export system protein LptA
MDATGPVTMVSKTQVATGDRGSYDKEQNKVWLFGNVTLSDSGNVTKGDKLTYDLTTGEAVVEVDKTSGRVHGQFIPGSTSADAADKSTPKKDAGATAGDKPKAAKKKALPDESSPKP